MAAMEEFHESEVLWPDHHPRHDDRPCCHGHQKQQQLEGSHRAHHVHAAACGRVDARRRPAAASSAPVAIPERAATWAQCHCCEDDDDGFVPPHVVMARRRCSESEERAACPMCVGQGRTLKGRDLQCVRTAVLRMTGFLET